MVKRWLERYGQSPRAAVDGNNDGPMFRINRESLEAFLSG
jgi:hypothetical protein